MNSSSSNSRFLNSLLPLNSTPKANANVFNTKNTSSNSGYSGYIFPVVIFLLVLAVIVTVFLVFKNQINDTWNNTKEVVSGFFGVKKEPEVSPPTPTPTEEKATADASESPESPHSQTLMEKILPGGSTGGDVFNVSSNKYTYYDAEPLCKALGAELATYDQVKEAWNRGADWCNYGWVKGQLAVYPTGDETYKKLQAGPEEQRMACGTPGVNGGFFDNPEMRFGVTCVGKKPVQSKHDQDIAAKGAPISPDAFAFDKKVSQFKSEADHIGILPFNGNSWSG
jgi:hypothetical protein